MNQTTNYELKLYEGTDLFNPLTVENVNASDIDSIMKSISDAAITPATELLTGTVHAITRTDTDRAVLVFPATSNYTAGETFTVDGTQVTALTPDGQTLATGSYVIGNAVLCVLNGMLLTVYVTPAKAKDSDKLDGEDSSYYATAGDLSTLDTAVGNISTKVGTAVLTTQAADCSGAINELNSNLSNYEIITVDSSAVSVTVGANTRAYGSYTVTIPTGYDVVGYSVFTTSWGGSWNIGITVLDSQNVVTIDNPSTGGTWQGYVKFTCKKASTP